MVSCLVFHFVMGNLALLEDVLQNSSLLMPYTVIERNDAHFSPFFKDSSSTEKRTLLGSRVVTLSGYTALYVYSLQTLVDVGCKCLVEIE